MSEPEIKYITVTSPSMVKGTRPCTCGCGGLPRHRVKTVMDEWAEEGPDGTLQVPVLWATKLSAGERDRHRASLEAFDKEAGVFRRYPEWVRPHWLAVCLRDHQNHRIWGDLEEARRQFGDLDDDEVEKLVAACNKAQEQPGRAEGNADAPSETTTNGKVSGDTPAEPGTPILIGSLTT